MKKLTIFLAEDNGGDVLLIREALAKYDVVHDLCVAEDGGEALDFISRMGEPDEPPFPDVMLLDINLPKVDGPAVLAEFRKHPQCATTPVIAISSSDTPKERDRLARLGITRYFRKPLDLDEFLRLGFIVREVMGEAPESEIEFRTAAGQDA